MLIGRDRKVDSFFLGASLGGLGIAGSSVLFAAGVLSLAQHRLPSIRLGCLSSRILKNPKGAKIAGCAMITASALFLLATAGAAGSCLKCACRKEPIEPRKKPPVVTVDDVFLSSEKTRAIRQPYPVTDGHLITIDRQSSRKSSLSYEVEYPTVFPIEAMRDGKAGKMIRLSRETVTLIHKKKTGTTTIYSRCPVYYEENSKDCNPICNRYFLIHDLKTKDINVFKESDDLMF